MAWGLGLGRFLVDFPISMAGKSMRLGRCLPARSGVAGVRQRLAGAARRGWTGSLARGRGEGLRRTSRVRGGKARSFTQRARTRHTSPKIGRPACFFAPLVPLGAQRRSTCRRRRGAARRALPPRPVPETRNAAGSLGPGGVSVSGALLARSRAGGASCSSRGWSASSCSIRGRRPASSTYRSAGRRRPCRRGSRSRTR